MVPFCSHPQPWAIGSSHGVILRACAERVGRAADPRVCDTWKEMVRPFCPIKYAIYSLDKTDTFPKKVVGFGWNFASNKGSERKRLHHRHTWPSHLGIKHLKVFGGSEGGPPFGVAFVICRIIAKWQRHSRPHSCPNRALEGPLVKFTQDVLKPNLP